MKEKIVKEERFITERPEIFGAIPSTKIITDKETGVQYLFVSQGYSGGLCALVDDKGLPLINKNFLIDKNSNL